MTTLTTLQMIGFARAWLATQGNSTPRDILSSLHDMVVNLLGNDNPPNLPTTVGELEIKTPDLIRIANQYFNGASGLSPYVFLTQIKNETLSLIQKLPKWKCSMFFKGANRKVDSSLNFASIDSAESYSHQKYICDAIRRIGGDTLLFIAEKMFNNPSLQGQVGGALNYAASVGIKHLIIDLKNDNQNFSFSNMEAFIRQMADHYAWANSDTVAFMTCLETDEVLSVEKTQQMVRWCKQYAPLKRVIVGSQNLSFLKAIGAGAELWKEIETNPYFLSKVVADNYIANLQLLLPFGHVWAGEYWDGSSNVSKYITRRALEIGCAGIGSFVGSV